MNIDFQDRIDDYLLGRMSDGDIMAFEREIRQNTELREQVEFTKSIQTAIKSRGEKLKKMQEWGDDYMWTNDRYVACQGWTGSGYENYPAPSKEQTYFKSRSSRKMFYWISGIAAIFIAGFFLVDNLFVMESERTASPSSYEYGNMRGGTDFTDIQELLVSQDFETALKQIGERERELVDVIAVLKSDSTQESERKEYELQLIKLKKDNLNWLKVYALKGLNRIDEAIVLLDVIRNSESGYKEKADSLYHVIKK